MAPAPEARLGLAPGLGQDPAWQQFWTSGAVDTFGSSVSAVMAPETERSPPLVAHWRAWMRSLPTRGELLDLCTGNGVVLSHLLLAQEQAAWRGLGVDLAQPRPDWLRALTAAQRERIQVVGGISADRLPFEASRFAAVTSQYGIEYADLDRAAIEAVRVLQSGGRLGWVMHHAQGRPAVLAREELAHLTWLQQVDWLSTVTEALHAMGPGAPAGGQPLRAKLDRLAQALAVRAASSPCPDLLQDVGSMTAQCLATAQRQSTADAVDGLTHFHRALLQNGARLQNLIDCALDTSSWEGLMARITGLGVTVHADSGPLHDRGHLMGWWLHGRLD